MQRAMQHFIRDSFSLSVLFAEHFLLHSHTPHIYLGSRSLKKLDKIYNPIILAEHNKCTSHPFDEGLQVWSCILLTPPSSFLSTCATIITKMGPFTWWAAPHTAKKGSGEHHETRQQWIDAAGLNYFSYSNAASQPWLVIPSPLQYRIHVRWTGKVELVTNI